MGTDILYDALPVVDVSSVTVYKRESRKEVL
jgi:hypothetical protein